MTITQCERALRVLDKEIANETASFMKQYIQDNVGQGKDKYSKGALKKSIRIVERNGVYYVGTPLHYAKYVDKGRGSVVPKRAKTLRFKTPDGRVVHTKYASPMKGIGFIDATKAEMGRRVRIVWQKIIQRSVS